MLDGVYLYFAKCKVLDPQSRVFISITVIQTNGKRHGMFSIRLYKNWNDISDCVFEVKMAEIEARLVGMSWAPRREFTESLRKIVIIS